MIEGALGIWLPPTRAGLPPRFLLAFARDPSPADLAAAPIAAGALTLHCGVPFEQWTIAVDGDARLWARAEDLGEHPKRTEGDRQRRAALRRVGAAVPLRVRPDERGRRASLRAAGLGQRRADVSGERLTIDGAGLRDHSWGVRDWQGVPYWRWMGMLVDPEHFLLVNNVGLESGAEVVGGCLMLGGELSPIVTGRTEGTQRDFVAHATDELGPHRDAARQPRSAWRRCVSAAASA